MKISDTLEVYLGLEDARNAEIASELPPEGAEMLQNPVSNGIVIGLGINRKEGLPLCLVLVSLNGYLALLHGTNPIELVDYIKDNIPQFDTRMAIVIAGKLAEAFANTRHEFNIPRYKAEIYGAENVPKPTSESRELTTVRDTQCLKLLMELVPSKKNFVELSKRLLSGNVSMIVMATKESKENDLDVRYVCMARIGERTNDPLEAKLLGMIAYQPEVLNNGVMFNTELAEDMKEHFESEYNKHFKF